MFRSITRAILWLAIGLRLGVLGDAEGQPNPTDPIMAPNPLTTTLSIFRSNMEDKIMKSAAAMPEAKYSYRPTKDVRSFAEILNHVADISYILCSNVKGEANPAAATAKVSKAKIMDNLKSAFAYCDAVYAGFSDAHLNEPADFWVRQDEQDVRPDASRKS